MSYTEVSSCRICHHDELEQIINLGSQPLTGVFLKPEEPDPVAVPLELVSCINCMFLQLKYDVDPDLMYSSYFYRSGTNHTMRQHLAGVAADACESVELKFGDIVIDTGCNDGTLLRSYQDDSIVRIGVDPSDAIKAITPDQNITAVNGYFTRENVEPHMDGKKARVITSISMFYDLTNPTVFIEDIKYALDDDGVWIVEMNYTCDMIETLGYDMISHEHVAYYTFLTFERLVKSCGLYVSDISRNDINGGSIRLFVKKSPGETASVTKLRDMEREKGFGSLEAYRGFGDRVDSFRRELVAFIQGLKSRGQSVMAYGASTRGNTVMQHCDFDRNDIEAALDRNPLKFGLEMSGCRIPIISEQEGRDQKPDYLLILPYYFIDEFLEREAEYLKNGGKFIVYLPELRIISWEDGELKRELVFTP